VSGWGAAAARGARIRDDPRVIRLSIALFLVQAGFHGYTASIPLALHRAGRGDAEIGALVGVAPLIQIAGALVGGVLIDRYGGVRLFIVGGLGYLVASVLLLVGGVAEQNTPFVVVARLLQGASFGFAVPAALSVIPRLVSTAQRGMALAVGGSAHNLTFVALPPISIAVLNAYGFDGVTILVAVLVVAGLAVALARPTPPVAEAEPHLEAATRRFGFAFRSSWLSPLLVTILYVLHWGLITAYLPQRAEIAGADIGLFFVADGLFVLLARVPAGWLADRTRPLWLVLIGLVMTALAVAVLLLPLSTPLLFLSGTFTGLGAAIIIIPLMLALTERSTDADRGSAFALYNACFAGAIAVGSIGTAPLIGSLGFEALLVLGIAALGISALFALFDRDLRSSGPGRMPRSKPQQPLEEAGSAAG
jgi:predicted MFS family arabinose efflux permease